MSLFDPSPHASRMLSVFRIVAGFTFFTAGTMKLVGWPPMPLPGYHFQPFTEIGVAAMLETVGGLAIILGLFTRPVAFVLAGEMAVAYFQVFAPKSFFPIENNGIPPMMFCFLFLYLTFAGGGAWSLDALIARRRAQRSGAADAEPEPEAARRV